MSARDDLYDALWAGSCDHFMSNAECDAYVAELIDNFTHELAEKIRGDIELLWDEDDFRTWNGGMFAADMIDPEEK